jgi:hypothetical protein
MKNQKLKNALAIAYVCISILSFVIILLIPTTREWFKGLSGSHPYIMGFIKFALLATAGELIAAFIKTGKITVPCKIIWRFVIWGVIGVWISFMMTVYKFAAAYMMTEGKLPGVGITPLFALFTSVLMNTSFGPTFMAVHKISDKMLEMSANKEKLSLKNAVLGVDWANFVSFTILKTVPFFWIPAHFVTFLLPGEYQVIMAAALSIALGVILSVGGRKKSKKEED